MDAEKRKQEVQLLDPKKLATAVNAKLLDSQTSVSLRDFVATHEWDAYEHFGDWKKQEPSFYKDLI